MKPTPTQQRIIKRMADGDWPDQTFDGWFWADDPGERISLRSLNAMVKHGWLVSDMTVRFGQVGARVELSATALAWLDSIGYEYCYR